MNKNQIDFLCKCGSGSNLNDVSEDSIDALFSQYEFYNQKYDKPVERKKAKPLMSTGRGFTLVRKDKFYDTEGKIPSIHIVCDEFTGSSAFKKGVEVVKYEDIFKSIGNFIPIPEGGNFKLGSQKNNGSSDHYQKKLEIIKQIFEDDKIGKEILSDDDIYQISKRIKLELGLGSTRHLVLEKKNKELEKPLNPLTNNINLRYWIYFEWISNNKTWENFVIDNYLQDFVDIESKEWVPLEFDNTDPSRTVRLIIKRGYRISNQKKDDLISDETITEYCKAVGLD